MGSFKFSKEMQLKHSQHFQILYFLDLFLTSSALLTHKHLPDLRLQNHSPFNVNNTGEIWKRTFAIQLKELFCFLLTKKESLKINETQASQSVSVLRVKTSLDDLGQFGLSENYL